MAPLMAPNERCRASEDFHPLLLDVSGRRLAVIAGEWANSGLTVAIASGHRMRTVASLFDEFATALRFPEYFGRNRDAFDECIGDLEGLSARVGYAIVVTEPDELLADVPASELDWLARSFAAATREWATPIERGEWWDRPALSFNVVLAARSSVEQSSPTGHPAWWLVARAGARRTPQ
jgi:hypothetical protein